MIQSILILLLASAQAGQVSFFGSSGSGGGGTTDNTKVLKTGDTMTGGLTLHVASVTAQGVIAGQITSTGSVTAATATIQGNSFSVGLSTFDVNNGKVGIGTAAVNIPTTLDVNGSAQFGLGSAKSTITATGSAEFAGAVTVPNNVAFQGRTAAGAAKELVKIIPSGNTVRIGDVTSGTGDLQLFANGELGAYGTQSGTAIVDWVFTGSLDVAETSTPLTCSTCAFSVRGAVLSSSNTHSQTFTEGSSSRTLSGGFNVEWSSANIHQFVLGASLTMTFTGARVGQTITLLLTQDSTGSRTITWPSGIRWQGGSAPTLTTTAGKVDLISLFYNGQNYYGSASLNY